VSDQVLPAAVPQAIAMPRKIGVLLVNLGTPEATDFWSVRRYLKEFLSDRRVVETPSLIWWPVLNLFILSTRPGRSGAAYKKIWNTADNESPLKTITRAQSTELAAWVAAGGLTQSQAIQTQTTRAQEIHAQEIEVDWAMRYGAPSIDAAISGLIDKGCDRLMVLPLYPQYAAATTATVGDSVFGSLARQRYQPALRIAAPYYDAPVYIEALVASLHAHIASCGFAPEVVLLSFHGIPQAYAEKGDPYPIHCEATFRLFAKALENAPFQIRMSYQSRFGPTEWLQPYTDVTVTELAKGGVKKILVITPGFAADCLETLEEIGMENRDFFLHNGGTHFSAVPCLNASAEGMRVIQDCVKRELAGWI
jgi:ferrochelatase